MFMFGHNKKEKKGRQGTPSEEIFIDTRKNPDIPEGTIFVDLVNIRKNQRKYADTIDTDRVHFCLTSFALRNLEDQLIQDHNGKARIKIVADDLGAIAAGGEDTAAYQNEGAKFLLHDRVSPGSLSLKEKFDMRTAWRSWRDGSAIDQLLKNISIKEKQLKSRNEIINANLATSLVEKKAGKLKSSKSLKKYYQSSVLSTLDVFKDVFKEAELPPKDEAIERLVPSFTTAHEFIISLYETNVEFRKLAEKAINRLVKDEQRRLRNVMTSRTLISKPFTEERRLYLSNKLRDNEQSVINIRNYLLEKTTLYFLLGIIARILNRPFRLLVTENNELFQYIGRTLIGSIHSGESAIQTIGIQVGEFKNSLQHSNFFWRHPYAYSSYSVHSSPWMPCYDERYKRKHTSSTEKRIMAPIDYIMQLAIVYLQSSEKLLPFLEMVLKEVMHAIDRLQKNIARGMKQQNRAKIRYHISSRNPGEGEVFLLLSAYLASGKACLETLESFKFILEQIPSAVNNTNIIATFNDSDADAIPRESVLFDGICIHKNSKGIEVDRHNTGRYLHATHNMLRELMDLKECKDYFMVSVNGTLEATNNGESDRAPYQAVSERFLQENKKHYAKLPLDNKNIQYITWNDWLDDSALKQLLVNIGKKGASQAVYNIDQSPSSLEDYKAAFDFASTQVAHEMRKILIPSIAVSSEYLLYLYKSGNGEHSVFRGIVDNIVGKFAAKELSKLNLQSGDTDARQKIILNKFLYSMEEGEQYLTLGTAMFTVQKPLRCLHQGTNSLFQYIERNLIGRLSNGNLTIQLVETT